MLSASVGLLHWIYASNVMFKALPAYILLRSGSFVWCHRLLLWSIGYNKKLLYISCNYTPCHPVEVDSGFGSERGLRFLLLMVPCKYRVSLHSNTQETGL